MSRLATRAFCFQCAACMQGCHAALRRDRSDAPRSLRPLPSITLPRPASALCPDPPPRCPDPPRARGAAAAPRRAAVALLCDAGDRPGGTAGLPADSRGCGALTAAGGRALCDRSGRARCRAASVDGCRRFGRPRLGAGAAPSGVSSVPFLLPPPPPCSTSLVGADIIYIHNSPAPPLFFPLQVFPFFPSSRCVGKLAPPGASATGPCPPLSPSSPPPFHSAPPPWASLIANRG